MPKAYLLLLVSLFASAVRSDDWPHWRGPDRNDVVSEESGWNGTDWLGEELWQFSAGEGSSSPIAVGDRVYLTGWEAGRETLFCLNAKTGKEIWRQAYKCPRFGRHAVGDQTFYSGAVSTPEYDSESKYLFTMSIDGDLITWDTARNGAEVWKLNLYDRYAAERRPEVAVRKRTRRDYGYTTSPLLLGDQLIVEVGGSKGNLVAFDKRTGRELWTSQNKDEAGHTGGPVPITVEGVPCVAVLTLRNLVVTRTDADHAGEQIATYPWTTDYGNNIATPAVFEDSVVFSSAYNHASMCRIQVTLKGAEKVWENDKIATGVCSPVIHDGKIYWAWRGVHCVDFETGNEIWKGGKVAAPGSVIITGDDRMIIYGNKGDLILAETAKRSPSKFTQLASRKVFGKTDAWPHVVFTDGRVICRDRSGAVRCLGVRSSD